MQIAQKQVFEEGTGASSITKQTREAYQWRLLVTKLCWCMRQAVAIGEQLNGKLTLSDLVIDNCDVARVSWKAVQTHLHASQTRTGYFPQAAASCISSAACELGPTCALALQVSRTCGRGPKITFGVPSAFFLGEAARAGCLQHKAIGVPESCVLSREEVGVTA